MNFSASMEWARICYGVVLGDDEYHDACRVYAPVGNHEDLLPYLVRRLLENGANTSFVNRIVDEDLPVDKVAEDPVERVSPAPNRPHTPAFLCPAISTGMPAETQLASIWPTSVISKHWLKKWSSTHAVASMWLRSWLTTSQKTRARMNSAARI